MYRRQSHGLKTCLQWRDFHTLLTNDSFSSPTDMRSHIHINENYEVFLIFNLFMDTEKRHDDMGYDTRILLCDQI